MAEWHGRGTFGFTNWILINNKKYMFQKFGLENGVRVIARYLALPVLEWENSWLCEFSCWNVGGCWLEEKCLFVWKLRSVWTCFCRLEWCVRRSVDGVPRRVGVQGEADANIATCLLNSPSSQSTRNKEIVGTIELCYESVWLWREMKKVAAQISLRVRN